MRSPKRRSAPPPSSAVPRATAATKSCSRSRDRGGLHPLPNDLHVPWSIAAARPVSSALREAARLERSKPSSWRKFSAKRASSSPKASCCATTAVAGCDRADSERRIGPVRAVQTEFSYHNTDPSISNRKESRRRPLRHRRYAINTARWIFGCEPRACRRLRARSERGCDSWPRPSSTWVGQLLRGWYAARAVQRGELFGTRGSRAQIPLSDPRSSVSRVRG